MVCYPQGRPAYRPWMDARLRLGCSRRLGDRVATFLERSQVSQLCILVIVLLATCLLIGDGVLTPAQSGETAEGKGWWGVAYVSHAMWQL